MLCQYTVPCFLMFLPTINLRLSTFLPSVQQTVRPCTWGCLCGSTLVCPAGTCAFRVACLTVSVSVFFLRSHFLSLLDTHLIPAVLQLVSPSSPLPALPSFSPRHRGSQKEGSEDAHTLLQVPQPMITPGVGLRFPPCLGQTTPLAAHLCTPDSLAGSLPWVLTSHPWDCRISLIRELPPQVFVIIWQVLYTLNHLLRPEMRF